MAELKKSAIERIEKEKEMNRIIEALTISGIEVERVIDKGTLAYMIKDGDLEGRFITIKVVLTKEFNEEELKGFDINEAMNEYDLKLKAELEKELKRKEKLEKEAKKKAKIDKVKI